MQKEMNEWNWFRKAVKSNPIFYVLSMIISECIDSNNLDEFSVYAVLDRKVAGKKVWRVWPSTVRDM